MANDIVAHFTDGRIVKGTSLDVDPAKPRCHIRTEDKRMVEVKLADLKALYFVRDLTGDPARIDVMEPSPDDPRLRGAFRIELKFSDGERLIAITTRYPPNRPFFFVLPVDPHSNNIRILINRAAVTSMSGG